MHDLKNELRVHWALSDCEGILQLQELVEDQNFVYFVLEYQASGSLLDHLLKKEKFTEAQTKLIMEQLLLTVDFIHKKGIIHRDLKLDNILITKIVDSEQYDVKIADFGLSAFYDRDREGLLTHKCGTLRYIAPEILRGRGYDNRCDIFSVGSIFFNLITGYHLF